MFTFRHGARVLFGAPFLFASVLVLPAAATVAAPAGPPAAEPQAVSGQLLVGYEAGAGAVQRAAARRQVGAYLLDRVVRAAGSRAEVELVALPAGLGRDQAIRRFANLPGVAFAEPNWIVHHEATSDDPSYVDGSLWGMYGDGTTPANRFGSQAGEAWAAGSTGSRSVYVGIIDEGIDISHPDLRANTWVNPFDPVNGVDDDGNGYVDDVNGWDFANRDRTVYDGGSGDAHGTHVAGTIGAVGGNGAGVAGVAWNVTMISGKFLGRNGGTTDAAIKAVDYFTDLKVRHGLNIIATNNSWGGGGFSQGLLDAISRGASQNILFIAAAGNDGTNNDTTVRYPSAYDTSSSAARYDAVIAVAALTSSGAKASWSNYGSRTVDLGAPGAGIVSTLPKNTYGSYSGTSMATPHVTGGAVVVAAATGHSGSALRADLLTVAATTSLATSTVSGGRLDVPAAAGLSSGGGGGGGGGGETSVTVKVASIQSFLSGGKTTNVNSTVTVVTSSNVAVAGATVSADLLRNGVVYVRGTGTTGSNGTVTFTLKSAPSGCYELRVTAVSASGATWDGVSPPTNAVCKG